MSENVRWIQRFENYKKALRLLEKAVELTKERALSDLEKEGLIQRFEYSKELAWQTLKDFYELMGETDIQGSRDAFQLAIKRGLINNGKAVMETIKSINKTAHTYNEATANEIFNDIVNEYYYAFVEIKDALEKEKQKRKL